MSRHSESERFKTFMQGLLLIGFWVVIYFYFDHFGWYGVPIFFAGAFLVAWIIAIIRDEPFI